MTGSVTQLTHSTRIAYGAGCILYGLSLVIVNSYVLVFFQNVLHLDNAMAGYIVFVAQIVDASLTPVIAIGSDKISGCGRYSRRKIMNLVGRC